MWNRTITAFCIGFIGCAMSSRFCNYQVFYQNERIFTPCEEYPDMFLSAYTNFEDLGFETLENDSIRVYGELKLTEKYENPMKVSTNFYKRENGQWVDTVYTFARKDLCDAIFSPTEFWYKIALTLPPEKRKCPFPDGFSNNFDLLADVKLYDIPDKTIEGEIKMTTKLFKKHGKELMACFNVYMDLVRI